MFIWPDNERLRRPLEALKGVGPARARALAVSGFNLVGDLLGLCPSGYQDRREIVPLSELVDGRACLTRGFIASVREGWSPKSRRRYLEAVIEEDGHYLSLVWFNYPFFLRKSLLKGRGLLVFGRPAIKGRWPRIVHPELEAAGAERPEIRPFYPEIGGLKPGLVGKLVAQAANCLENEPPLLPAAWLKARGLNDPWKALLTLHQPPADRPGRPPRVENSRAFGHLALYELMLMRLLTLCREADQPGPDRSRAPEGRAMANRFWRALRFRPSPEQRRVYDEIAADLARPRPMNRLLQGEVGGGKTAVALAAAFNVIGQRRQAAIIAPTDILASQHLAFIKPIARRLGLETVFISGFLPAALRGAAQSALAEGRAALAVGTQALLSPKTVFHDLGLAVIDEQHRFGVNQRLALRLANRAVDLLALSATPIPRSLALTLYGDLDISSLKGRLPGRAKVETILIPAHEPFRKRYGRLAAQVAAGAQAYVVTPKIEAGFGQGRNQDEDGPALEAAQELWRVISALMPPGCPVELLHGRLEPEPKARVMEEFRQGRIKVLVATTVIEVGLDVPGASIIIVEGAERFGLAQLHQLRGRVGRDGRPGQCWLAPGPEASAEAWSRLNVLAETDDGYALAEEDLQRRGPGERLGLRQSGWPRLDYASFPRDLAKLPLANELAEDLWRNGRGPEDPALARFFARFFTLPQRLAQNALEAG